MTVSDRFTSVRDQLEQNRVARQRSIRQALERATDRTTHLHGTLRAGARVFDTISGEEGEVVGGTTATVVVPTEQR